MPEGLEAEMYRRSAQQVVGRVIETVTVDDNQAFAVELRGELPGCTVMGTRRLGKLVVVELEAQTGEPIELGLHFGMTGRLIVDDVAAIAELEYSSGRDNPKWDRFIVTFSADSGGGTLRVNDPRRWAKFTLDPKTDALGPDMFAITADDLANRFARRRRAVKSALLDQSLLAGLGNMLVDELLFHIEVNPARPANELTAEEIDRLVSEIATRLPAMLKAGGSHRGTIDPEARAEQPPCPHPLCSSNPQPLSRATIGGRTTLWCANHQQ